MLVGLNKTALALSIVVDIDIQFTEAQAKHAQDCSCVSVTTVKCQTSLILLENVNSLKRN